MASNSGPVKRYLAHASEDESKMPIFNLNAADHQHEPLLALLALVIAYFILDATKELKHSLIDTILLRSFPAWADQYSITKADQPPHWLRRLSPSALTGLIAISSLRLWNDENLWKLVARSVPWYILFEAGPLALLWGLEQILLLSWSIANWSGWVPFNEPDAYLRLSGRAEPQGPGDELEKHECLQQHERKQPYTSDDGWDGKTRKFLNSISQSPARYCGHARRIETEAYRGTEVQASTGMETYHSITADEKYQARSFEELRLEHYQEPDSGVEGGGQEEQAKSLLGRSISFLSDSLFGNSSLASRDSFGRTTVGQGELLLDGVAAAPATEREDWVVIPDLLTGTPRKLFT